MSSTWSILQRYYPALLGGALTTLEMALIAWIGGLLLGVPIAIWRTTRSGRSAREALALLALAISSIPIIVYLLWAYYPLQSALGISVPPFATAAVVFTLYNAFAVAENLRGAIEDLPVAYALASRVTGIPRRLHFRAITMPLALRAALPGYLVSQVTTLHLTLFASLISVDDLFRATQRINAIEYNAVGVFSLLGLFYLILSFPLLALSRVADRRLAKIGLER